eukprot:scaffold7381_cov70-Skeletonema_dohrnii-CCMP3373.AAC.1
MFNTDYSVSSKTRAPFSRASFRVDICPMSFAHTSSLTLRLIRTSYCAAKSLCPMSFAHSSSLRLIRTSYCAAKSLCPMSFAHSSSLRLIRTSISRAQLLWSLS